MKKLTILENLLKIGLRSTDYFYGVRYNVQ